MNLELIRSAAEDMHVLQKWSEAPSVRKWIGIEDWQTYFRSVSVLPGYYLYTVYIDGRLVSLVAAERINGYMALCVIVDPCMQGKGIGTAVIGELISKSEMLFGTICGYEAGIFEGNVASRRCFEKCGFRFTQMGADGEMIYRYEV